MTSETYQDYTFDRLRGQKRPLRPKLLKLTDVSMPHRNRKKTKTKSKERSQSNIRERIYDDPAYTDDISHLAIPNKKPSAKNEKTQSTGSLYSRKNKKKKGVLVGYDRDESCSSDDACCIQKGSPLNSSKRGRTLERSNHIDQSPKKRDKKDRDRKRNLSLDNKLSSQKENLQTSDVTTESEAAIIIPSRSSKMQLGRRFLKGEIGIKSFNYYLLKEGLKSSKKFVEKQRNSLIGNISSSSNSKHISRSEENIYEEIFFKDRTSDTESIPCPDCEICAQQCTNENCEFCLPNTPQSRLNKINADFRRNSFQAIESSNSSSNILEFQSYNPNNPGVFKIETTPVAFTSDYNPIQQFQHHGSARYPIPMQQYTQYNRRMSANTPITLGTIAPASSPNIMVGTTNKSSSSSDSLHHKKYNNNSTNINEQTPQFYEPPPTSTIIYSPLDNVAVVATAASVAGIRGAFGGSQILIPFNDQHQQFQRSVYQKPQYHLQQQHQQQQQQQQLHHPHHIQPKLYKSNSRISLMSEYSARSENSNRNFVYDRYSRTPGEISDSSLGDSIFSYQLLQHQQKQQQQQQYNQQHLFQHDEHKQHQQRRYFGSTESCRYIDIPPTSPHCRRCSLDSGGVGIGCSTNPPPPTTTATAGKEGSAKEKCGYSDTCRYDCKNCDCSSSYFSSDFDELYYNNRGEGGGEVDAGKNYYNDTQRQQRMDLKQNKYAQDFFKHVNDVKRSIYQTEMMNSYSTIPPPKQSLSGEPAKSYIYNRRKPEHTVYSTLPLTAKENLIYATPSPVTTTVTTTTTTTSPALQRTNKSMTGAIPKSNNSNNTSSSSLSHQSNVPPKSPKPEKIKNLKSKLLSSNSSLSSGGGGGPSTGTPTGKRKVSAMKVAKSTEDDDVFYDARSEDSASTTTNTQNTTAELKKNSTTNPHPIPRERKSLQHVAKKNPAASSPKHNNIPDNAESAQNSSSLQTTQQQPIPSQRIKEKVELDDVKVSNINILPMREKVAEQHVKSAQNVDGDGKETGRAEHEISLESNDAGETRNR
ncbi:hypothetical protein ACFFRR_010969 [Megaselia abdita]